MLGSILSFSLSMTLSATPAAPPTPTSFPDEAGIAAMSARFQSTPINADLGALSEGNRRALTKLIAASQILDRLFVDQLWSGNMGMIAKLRADGSPLAKTQLAYYWLNKGPWSAIDAHAAFMAGVPPHKPLGANFYPEDASKTELEAWMAALPDAQRTQAQGFFSVVRRDAAGKLMMVPYSEAYREYLTPAAALLREASRETDNATLKTYLAKRADALMSNDYYDSDLAWMELDSPLEVTFGPYETYNDELFGYKAAFESYLGIRDEAQTAWLTSIGKHLQAIEDALPVKAALRNPKVGGTAPMRVVNLVFNSGDASHGVQTAAFNLPNDERIVQTRGSKRVMLENIQRAKFDQILRPIAQRVLSPEDRDALSFQPFFAHILLHEVSHGLGLHEITVKGKKSTPRAELTDLYSSLEEARADVLGLYALQYLMNHAREFGIELPSGEEAERQVYTTYLASSFRTLRFGATEAHARGMALQLNWMLDKKGVVVRKDGTFHVDLPKMKKAVRGLATELITLHATGDRARGEKMLKTLGVLRPEVVRALSGLRDLPTDIAPVFETARSLVSTVGEVAPPLTATPPAVEASGTSMK